MEGEEREAARAAGGGGGGDGGEAQAGGGAVAEAAGVAAGGGGGGGGSEAEAEAAAEVAGGHIEAAGAEAGGSDPGAGGIADVDTDMHAGAGGGGGAGGGASTDVGTDAGGGRDTAAGSSDMQALLALPQAGCKIFLEGLPTSVKEDAVTAACVPHGQLHAVKVPGDGTAVIQYTDRAAAERALKEFDGRSTSALFPGTTDATATGVIKATAAARRNVLRLANLPFHAWTDDIKRGFKELGAAVGLVDFKIRPPQGKMYAGQKNGGTGRAMYRNDELAERAHRILTAEGVTLCGRRPAVHINDDSVVPPGGKRDPRAGLNDGSGRYLEAKSKLYVSGLPLDARAGDVSLAFAKFGTVLAVDLPPPRGANKLAFAFVHYAEPESAGCAQQAPPIARTFETLGNTPLKCNIANSATGQSRALGATVTPHLQQFQQQHPSLPPPQQPWTHMGVPSGGAPYQHAYLPFGASGYAAAAPGPQTQHTQYAQHAPVAPQQQMPMQQMPGTAPGAHFIGAHTYAAAGGTFPSASGPNMSLHNTPALGYAPAGTGGRAPGGAHAAGPHRGGTAARYAPY